MAEAISRKAISSKGGARAAELMPIR